MGVSRASRGIARLVAGLVVLVPLCLVQSSSLATTLDRRVVSGGTMHEAGGGYILSATVGEVGVVGLVQSTRYTLGAGFWQGHGNAIAAVAVPSASEIQFVNGLRQNFPNPFAGETSIVYTVGTKSPVRLTIYDVTGRRVKTLTNADHEPGRYSRQWEGRDEGGEFVASGVYFYRLDIGSWTETHRMLRLR